jgi:hypothetical protein
VFGQFSFIRKAQTPAAGAISKEELRSELQKFKSFFTDTIGGAAEELDSLDPTPKTRRLTLMWRVRMSYTSNAMIEQDDPVAAFLNEWALSVRMSQYFKGGEGSTMFGDNQTIAVAAAEFIEEEIEIIGALFLQEEAFTETREHIHRFAGTKPIQGTFSRTVAYVPEIEEGRPTVFTDVLELPMAPFKALGGVDRGATAIHGFTNVADHFSGVIEGLPESTRWQLMLLLLEMEETEMAQSILASMSGVSENTAQLVTVAKGLPKEIRKQASTLIEEIDSKQAGLQATLDRAEKTIAAVERTLERADPVIESIDRTAQSITETGRAWESAVKAVAQTVQELSKEETSVQEKEEPFDINEYRMTADALTGTANELTALTVEIRELIESQHLTKRIEDLDTRATGVLDKGAAEARGLTNLMAWRAAQLIILAFVLALFYRIIVSRFLARPN